MDQRVSLANDEGVRQKREPVKYAGRRVPGLYQRGDVFEFVGRIDKRVKTLRADRHDRHGRASRD